MSFLKKAKSGDKLLAILFLMVALPCLIYMFNVRWEGTSWRYSIHSDGKGYYAYLPAFFIYGDSDFKFVNDYEGKYYDPGNYVHFATNVDGAVVNKYWSGTALMILPFFLMADNLAPLLNYPNDGYSFPYQASVCIAAIFWLLVGVTLIYFLLLNYFRLRKIPAILGILAFVFGSNLFYYTVCEPSMSHVYSFSALSAFLYFLSKYIRFNSIRALWTSGFFAGLILLIRPTNALLLLSFLILFRSFDEVKLFFRNLFSSPVFPIITILISFSVVYIQLYYFHTLSGKYWIDSYVNENFNFLKPELYNFLFSYRKGLWVYTPIALLSLLGLITLFKQSRFWAISTFLSILLYYYVLSSWWMWFYGGSFGMRAAIDGFPILIVLLAHFFNSLSTMKLRLPVVVLISCCLFLNVVQTYQYTHWILPWDNMTKEKYWKIFLQTSPEYVGVATPDN
jgi:hypothetical protein